MILIIIPNKKFLKKFIHTLFQSHITPILISLLGPSNWPSSGVLMHKYIQVFFKKTRGLKKQLRITQVSLILRMATTKNLTNKTLFLITSSSLKTGSQTLVSSFMRNFDIGFDSPSIISNPGPLTHFQTLRRPEQYELVRKLAFHCTFSSLAV